MAAILNLSAKNKIVDQMTVSS